MYDKILFVDFDGTVTTVETLSQAMEMCVEPSLFKQGMEKMQSGEWTLKDAVTFAFENITSDRMTDIMEYVRGVPIRDGFEELLNSMEKLGIPVVIISGGLEPYVNEKLEPYKNRILAIHSVKVDTSGENIKLITPYEGETDVIEKTKIMDLYDYRYAICVGDGLTDVRMALASQMIFARDTLAKVLTKKGVDFTPWDDFNDVREGIE